MGELGLALTLVIRLYDNGVLGERDRAVTIATASTILLAADIPTSWPDCTAVCHYAMGPAELAVRFQRTAVTGRFLQDTSLGYAYVDPLRREGALATLYLDRIDALAAATGIDRRVVLGRAIAHEVGHLLLGTNEHADTGLMRAVWTRRALQANRPSDWMFGEEERGDLVRALARRVPTTQESGVRSHKPEDQHGAMVSRRGPMSITPKKRPGPLSRRPAKMLPTEVGSYGRRSTVY